MKNSEKMESNFTKTLQEPAIIHFKLIEKEKVFLTAELLKPFLIEMRLKGEF